MSNNHGGTTKTQWKISRPITILSIIRVDKECDQALYTFKNNSGSPIMTKQFPKENLYAYLIELNLIHPQSYTRTRAQIREGGKVPNYQHWSRPINQSSRSSTCLN
ncbi:hypothetical protein Lal_00035475 [Lupinus albus]|nr:hypothetical protein Lal_00035475 [Lupinus albus]